MRLVNKDHREYANIMWHGWTEGWAEKLDLLGKKMLKSMSLEFYH